MKLKRYQADTLSILRRFLEEARVIGPRDAYESITQEPEQAGRLGRYRGKYKPLDGLPDVPYVCLRLPTGGGKTVLASHAVAITRDAWVEKDFPMVLWLVPTNIIRFQTAEALKNPQHPYREALDTAFDGRVRVFDIGDFTHIRPHDLQDHCCIVVGTIQTLRVRDSQGRKVYAHNESMEPHFNRLENIPKGLETLDGGGPKFSFANLMHVHRPLMIVDEAHNAVTGLTREMQGRVNPCAVVEFTATPRVDSNILHSVTAQELKAEDMIKLPIMLSECDSWQTAVNRAVIARESLAKDAAEEAGTIRPIVLFQAQPKNREVTAEVLKKHLIETERIPESKIAVATGSQRELDGIDLFDSECPIEHVITVEALKEGWDCSFAYIFCSVVRIQDATDVEQLLGRVLRMPYARRRKAHTLNRAYAFLSEPSFGAAARGLIDKLIAMGFDEDDANDNVEMQQREIDTGLFGPRRPPESVFLYSASIMPDTLARLKQCEGIEIHASELGKTDIVVTGHLSANLEGLIADAIPPGDRQGFDKAVIEYRRKNLDNLSPAELGETFVVPRLMSEVQGKLEFADTDTFLEWHDWSLLDHSTKLDETEFAVRETANHFEIDLDGRRITYSFASQDHQLSLNVDVEGWTPEALVIWLDRQVRQPDIGQGDLLAWLSKLVHHLRVAREISISALMRCKFILARKVKDRIATIRQEERKAVYRRHLFEPTARVEVSFDHPFEFKDGMFRETPRHRGHWRPVKHFLGPNFIPAFDGAENGEESQCAQVIDALPAVRFWLRNVARHPQAFWLPTASGKFYPDFIARMNDDRLLVVEYKGAHIAEGPDTAEKRTIGELWQRKSNGRGVFVLAEKSVGGKDVRTQILEKLIAS